MKHLTTALVFLLLTGCTTIAEKGREVSDEAHRTVEFLQCEGGTRGSLMRHYAVSPERWDAWLTLCGYKGKELPRPIVP